MNRKTSSGFTLFKKGIWCLKENGFRYTLKKVLRRNYVRISYEEWMKKPLFTASELSEQRSKRFSKDIKFSIIVPLYNTPDAFLREMIESVQSQTYSNWELCLADGSDDEHGAVGEICSSYAQNDTRIKYRKLDKNLGISGNSNACIEMATGEYYALFDHDDILHPAVLHEVMTAICEKDADFIYTDEATFLSPDINRITVIHFKPDYAPDTLRSNNYVCHFTVFSRVLLESEQAFRSEYDGSQDHDLILRLTGKAGRIVHIPEVLYYWRAHSSSVAMTIGAKEYAEKVGCDAVRNSIQENGWPGTVESSPILPSIYRIKYELRDRPKISIIIPTCDHYQDLKKCIESIISKTSYDNFEIVIIENNSKETETFEYYDVLQNRYKNIKLVKWDGKGFNYSAINNYGIRTAASGDYYLLLNNDTEIITADWIEEMFMYAQRDDVGAVGAKLYYPDDTIQHAGIIVGLEGVAGHAFCGMPRIDNGYMGRAAYVQNLSAVTAACMMIRRKVWEEAGGLDEGFAVAFNDVDLCMRIRQMGYLIVWTPYAELYHYESKSRGLDDTREKRARFNSEIARFKSRWAKELEAGDPYYNPNLTLRRCDYSIKDDDEVR